jgi:hypothetical protein
VSNALKKYRVMVVRSQFATFEVEAENEKRAESKAAYKARNGEAGRWEPCESDEDVTRIEEVTQ